MLDGAFELSGHGIVVFAFVENAGVHGDGDALLEEGVGQVGFGFLEALLDVVKHADLCVELGREIELEVLQGVALFEDGNGPVEDVFSCFFAFDGRQALHGILCALRNGSELFVDVSAEEEKRQWEEDDKGQYAGPEGVEDEQGGGPAGGRKDEAEDEVNHVSKCRIWKEARLLSPRDAEQCEMDIREF